jgi:hypothetical protein
LIDATSSTDRKMLAAVQSDRINTWNALLRGTMPVAKDGSATLLPGGGAVWVHLTCALHDAQIDLVETILDEGYNVRALADFVSADRVRVLDGATWRCKAALQRRLFLCGRYDLAAASEYQSPTCVIVFALDYGIYDGTDDTDGVAAGAAPSPPAVPVALKFMTGMEQWTREVHAREEAEFDADRVIGLLAHYDASGDSATAGELLKRTGAAVKSLSNLDTTTAAPSEYKFLIVMPRADRSLRDAIQNEAFAGRNWHRVADITIEVATALQHMHKRSWMHGDIKPLNLMRVGRAWHLIDLDAAAAIDTPALARFTTAYLPPEAFALDADGDVQVRTNANATVAVDMWALGMTLYDMCVGFGDRVFTRLDKYENLISEPEKRRLMEWADRFKGDALSRIEYVPARALVARLLSKDPEDRPTSMRDVLNDPFLNVTRAERERAKDADAVRSMSRSMASVEAAAVATAAAVVPMAATVQRIDETTSRTEATAQKIHATTTETLARTKALARLVTEFPRSSVPRRVLILPEADAAALVAADAADPDAKVSLLDRLKQVWSDTSDKVSPFVKYRVFLCCDGVGHDSELSSVECACGLRPLHDGYPLSLPGPKLRKLAPLLQTGLKFLKYGLMAGKVVTGLPVPTQFGTDVFAGATDALALVDGFCDVFDNKTMTSLAEKADGLSSEDAKAAALDDATRAADAVPHNMYAAAFDTLAKMLEKEPAADGVTWLKDRNSTLLWQVADTMAPLGASSGGGKALLWLCRTHADAARGMQHADTARGQRFTLVEGGESLGAGTASSSSTAQAAVSTSVQVVATKDVVPSGTADAASPRRGKSNKVAPIDVNAAPVDVAASAAAGKQSKGCVLK